jgi:hypothetical protein
MDATGGLPDQYELIMTLDMLHDVASPERLLRGIREALAPSGAYLCLEFNSADTVEGNIALGPAGVFGYTSSVLYCLTTALAGGGESLGAQGLPESRLRALARAAGFDSVRKLPIGNPINALYVLR